MNGVKHQPATALPWRVSPSTPSEVQQESGVFTVGKMGMDGAVNALYIAHAANAYPKLVKALRELLADCDADLKPTDTHPARVLLRDLGEAE